MFVAQVLLEPQEGLMGSVVIVGILAAERWNVRGVVVAVVYQPPGAPHLQIAPDTPFAKASAHGEVHPLVYRNRETGDCMAPLTAPSGGTCGNASNAATTTAPSAESRKGSIGSSFGGTGDGHGGVEADGWGTEAATGSCADQLPSRFEAQYGGPSKSLPASHDNASGSGCGADNCCQHDLPGAGSNAGRFHGQMHSSQNHVESTGLSIVDCSSSNASEDTQQCKLDTATHHEPAESKSCGDTNADINCSNHSSEIYHERQASPQEEDSASVAEVASWHKPPATVLNTAARRSLPPLEDLRKPEELQPGASAKEHYCMPASTSAPHGPKGKRLSAKLPDKMEPASRSRNQAPTVEALPSKSEIDRGHGGRLAASLQRAGISLAGSCSSQAVDMLLSAGIVLGLTGVLISGIMMLVSS